jgi:hypothetical protein
MDLSKILIGNRELNLDDLYNGQLDKNGYMKKDENTYKNSDESLMVYCYDTEMVDFDYILIKPLELEKKEEVVKFVDNKGNVTNISELVYMYYLLNKTEVKGSMHELNGIEYENSEINTYINLNNSEIYVIVINKNWVIQLPIAP